MKRILIAGANGLLGQAVTYLLKDRYDLFLTGVESQFIDKKSGNSYVSMDITNASACKEIIKDFVPDAIINAASFTHVDQCEIEKELCWQVNVKGVENLAKLSRRFDIHLIHFSTDYVFDGSKGPYDENDRPKPLGYYGKSKLASENVLTQISCPFTVVRTCVIYGDGIEVKANFFMWVLNNLKENKQINVVDDQYNNPTLAEDLAEGTELILSQEALGVYHMAGAEYLNRYEFALAIADYFNLDQQLITPIKTHQLKQASKRPEFGGLKIEKAQNQLGYQPKSLQNSFAYLKRKVLADE